MLVYSSITLDWQGNILHAEFKEYEGDVDLCGGGKGGGSSTTNISSTPDYEYNARLASVAERQQGLSDNFYNWWANVQAPVEAANAAGQMELIPFQKNIAKEGLQAFGGMQSEFYNASRSKDPELFAARARADTATALAGAAAQNQRDMQRMGIDPTSGAAKAQQRDVMVAGAASLAGAANQGRLQGEESNIKNLTNAMNFGLR